MNELEYDILHDTDKRSTTVDLSMLESGPA